MSELEKELACENCASKYRLMYDEEQVAYTPDNCPFCGDLIEVKWDLGEGFDEEVSNMNDDELDWFEK